MSIGPDILAFLLDSPVPWRADWLWGLPLILLTVLLHVFGLGLMNQQIGMMHEAKLVHRHPTVVFTVLIGFATLMATFLHAVEAGLWAIAYRVVNAVPDFKAAMFYSMGAMTTYGHGDLYLPARWQMLGAIEALNGWLLFGLSTAFLFGLMNRVSFHAPEK
jgi:hypothetical protein